MYRGIIILMTALVSVSCASIKQGAGGTFEARPLIQQIIRMRAGHKGLTHNTCVEKNWFGECTKMDVIEYDLADPKVRERLIKMGFRCNIAGFRYKIHPDRAAFVRYQRTGGGWFQPPEETKLVNVVDQSELQILLDGATVCWSEVTYPNGIH
jgi:hypothetical protein